MSAREPASCDVPSGEHEGLSRLYPCGWRCSAHAPTPRVPETQAAVDHRKDTP